VAQPAAAALKLVAALPDARFAGWGHYFFGLLLKNCRCVSICSQAHMRPRPNMLSRTRTCRPHLSASDVMAAMERFGAAAALSTPSSPCSLNAKVQLLQLLSKDPARAGILRELAAQNRPDR